MLEHQPDGALPQLLRIPARSCHGSNLSRVEASRNPGAVQLLLLALLWETWAGYIWLALATLLAWLPK